MLAAVLTTVFFSLSAIFAARSVRAVGATRANLGRLAFAAVALGIVAHGWGGGLGGAGREWLFWSGVVGMGLGDLAVFAALPRLGTRLTVLMTQCVAAPLAAVAEYLWLGTTLSVAQITSGILLGSPGTSAAAYTLPTAALLDAALGNAKIGSAFDLNVVNVNGSASGVITMTTATGWTLVGLMTVVATAGTAQVFRARKTGDASWVLYRYG
jgi:uncharacterized membrane protein